MYIVGKNAVHVLWFHDPLSDAKVGLRFRRLKSSEEMKFRGEMFQAEVEGEKQAEKLLRQEDVFRRAGFDALAGIEPDCFARDDGSPIAEDDPDWHEKIVASGEIDHLLVLLGQYVLITMRQAKRVEDPKNSQMTSLCSAGVNATMSSAAGA